MDAISTTNASIALLFKAASLLSEANGNKTHEILKSYYMMRCKELSKGYGLPQKHFSEKIICSHCCLKWRKGTEINVKQIKLSKKQRKRITSQKNSSAKINKEHLLHSKELEQICGFCKHSTKLIIPKPNKGTTTQSLQPIKEKKDEQIKMNTQTNIMTKVPSSIYSNAAQVFSLSNKKNSLKNSKKEKPKIIKNNKKKKDKFAGLCKKAVLASAKLTEKNKNENKLSLFLKPSL